MCQGFATVMRKPVRPFYSVCVKVINFFFLLIKIVSLFFFILVKVDELLPSLPESNSSLANLLLNGRMDSHSEWKGK